MEFFIANIFTEGYIFVYFAVFITVLTFVFLFLRKSKDATSVSSTAFNKLSPHELEIRLRAYERLTLFLERIEPVGMVNRLELHNIDVDVLKATLIKNIIIEYEYNMSQQIYVSNELWKLIELVKNKMINSISVVSDSLNNKSNSEGFVKQMLKESRKNTLMLQKVKKVLKQEVRSIS